MLVVVLDFEEGQFEVGENMLRRREFERPIERWTHNLCSTHFDSDVTELLVTLKVAVFRTTDLLFIL